MVFLSFYLGFFACFVSFDDVGLLKRQCQCQESSVIQCLRIFVSLSDLFSVLAVLAVKWRLEE